MTGYEGTAGEDGDGDQDEQNDRQCGEERRIRGRYYLGGWPGQRKSLCRRSLAHRHRIAGGSQWPFVGNQMAYWRVRAVGRPTASRM
jgi:hypothetical protein